MSSKKLWVMISKGYYQTINLWGLSTYMSIYHAAFARDFTKVLIELIRFDRIFKYTWTTFWKANNYKKFHRFGWSHLGWACQAPNDGQDIQSVTRAVHTCTLLQCRFHIMF